MVVASRDRPACSATVGPAMGGITGAGGTGGDGACSSPPQATRPKRAPASNPGRRCRMRGSFQGARRLNLYHNPPSAMLGTQNLAKSYGARTLFEDVSLKLN